MTAPSPPSSSTWESVRTVGFGSPPSTGAVGCSWLIANTTPAISRTMATAMAIRVAWTEFFMGSPDTGVRRGKDAAVGGSMRASVSGTGDRQLGEAESRDDDGRTGAAGRRPARSRVPSGRVLWAMSCRNTRTSTTPPRTASTQIPTLDESTSIVVVASWPSATDAAPGDSETPEARHSVACTSAEPREVDHAPTTSRSARPTAMITLATSIRSARASRHQIRRGGQHFPRSLATEPLPSPGPWQPSTRLHWKGGETTDRRRLPRRRVLGVSIVDCAVQPATRHVVCPSPSGSRSW